MKRIIPLAILLTLIPIPFTPGAAAATFTEGFETFATFTTNPDQSWYDFSKSGTGSFFVSTADAASGSKSYFMDTTSGTSTFTFLPNVDLCLGETNIQFAWKLTALAAGVAFRIESTEGTSTVPAIRMQIDGAGVVTSVVSGVDDDSTDSNTQTVSGITIAANTWYNTTISMFCGYTSLPNPDGGHVNYGFADQNFLFSHDTNVGGTGSTSGIFWCVAVGCGDGNDILYADRFEIDVPAGANLYLDNFAIVGAVTTPPIIGATATSAVTNLVGFDVDPTGSTVVARTDGGENVKIWPAKTLGLADATIPTNCDADPTGDVPGSKGDMVSTLYGGKLVAFINCQADGAANGQAGDPEYFSIRALDGDVPTDEFPDCTPGSSNGQCPYDIGLSDFSEPGDSSSAMIDRITSYPWDYSRTGSTIGGFATRFVSWAFTTREPDPGEVGIAAYSRVKDVNDGNLLATQQYSSSEVEDFCTGVDNGNYYLLAADSGTNVNSFAISFTNGGTNDVLLTPHLSGGQTWGISNAASVACGGGRAAVVTIAGELWYTTRSGDVIWKMTGIGVAVRQVAMSEEFELDGDNCFEPGTTTDTSDADSDVEFCYQFIAVLDYGVDNIIRIINATSTTTNAIDEVGTIEPPSGSWFSLEMERTGGGIWAVSSTTINYHQIYNLTTLVPVSHPCSVDCEDDDDDPVLDPGENAIVGAGARIAEPLGLSEFGGNLLAGLMLMVLTTTGGAVGWSTQRTLGAIIGLVAGFLAAWAFGFFGVEVVFTLIVVCIIVLAFKFWAGRGG